MSYVLALVKDCMTRALEGKIEQALNVAESAEEYAEGTKYLPLATYARAQMLLASGAYAHGFKKALCRWDIPHEMLNYTHAQLEQIPRWKGDWEELKGKRVLVYSEMGFGDVLMLLRYVKYVRAQALHVTLQVPRGIERLASGCADWVIDSLNSSYVKSFAYRIPLFDIPAFLKDPVDGETPYLFPPLVDIPIPDLPLGPKVGVAWSGRTGRNVHRIREHFRSMPIKRVIAKAKELFPDSSIVSIQNQDQETAFKEGISAYWYEDFASTAAVMRQMDAIVTIDSSPVHLAGAIGHPNVHLLLDQGPDWRWYYPERWYPGITIHRCEQ